MYIPPFARSGCQVAPSESANWPPSNVIYVRHYDPIDWQQADMLAFVIVNGVVVGDLVTLAEERERVLGQVRHQLMADVAFKHLGVERDGHHIRLMPVEPTPPETTYLAIVHIDEEVGVPVAEYLRYGKRVYEYYPALQEGEEQ